MVERQAAGPRRGPPAPDGGAAARGRHCRQRGGFARRPERVVTFVIDSNPNYTNVCMTDCQFCAFYRKPGDHEAWTLTVEEVLAKVESAANPWRDHRAPAGWPQPGAALDYYLVVRETRRRFPQVTPHFFTASEIQTMAQVTGITFEDVLDHLWEAGQRTIPGGGAEVLSDPACAHASSPRRAAPRPGCPCTAPPTGAASSRPPP